MKKYILPVRSDIIELLPKVAKSEVGTVEIPINSNRGERVEMYLKAAHLLGGNPYCMAFIVWCFKECIRALKLDRDKCMPIQSQGNANKCFDYAKKLGKEVLPNPKVGDILIYRHKTVLFRGHACVIVEVIDNNTVITVEGNTSSDDKGSQRDGGGVFIKKRKLNTPLGSLLVRGLIGWEYID